MPTNLDNLANNNIDNDEISLKELILKMNKLSFFLKTKIKLIFITGILGALIGLILAFYDKPIYKATLTFAMEEDKGNSGSGISGALGLASSFGIDLGGSGGGGAFALSNLSELMKSRLIVEKVLLSPVSIKNESISLVEYYINKNNLRKSWKKNSDLKNIYFPVNADPKTFSFLQDSILKKIYEELIDKNNLSIVQKDKKITILAIEVKSRDELFSKLFCENLAKETSDFYIETKSRKARINVDVLQKQVDSIRISLNNSIANVAAETDNVYNLNPAFNIKGTPTKKKQIDVQANTSILTNLVVQLELAKINLRKETPLIQLIDSPKFPLEKEQIEPVFSSILGFLLSIFLVILILIFSNLFKNLEIK